MQNKVSVITIVKNAELTIGKTIESLKSQTYKNIQYIIIDGASSDNTKNIVDSHSDAVDVFISEPDNGSSDALNKALSYVKGKYVIWLAADDWFGEDFLHTAVDALTKSNADLFFGAMSMYRSTGELIQTHYQNSNIKFCLSRAQGINFPSMMCSAAYFKEIGGLDLSLKYCNDIEWLLRAYSIREPSCVFSNKVTIHRADDGKVSQNARSASIEMIKLYRRYGRPTAHLISKLILRELLSLVRFIRNHFRR
tara:strand:- start:1356 stop:2111 length:756 start_codon:yes stop_codon:yes gene_type:complete